ncbi:MAG: 3-phosphoshikimate 1-carboxyvinyltransferase [Zetaproteobacteria bacterium]|nr:3-phosphoshikimate 1-carboxyvinyltransferase [Zetaproteobacteria bacterium]
MNVGGTLIAGPAKTGLNGTLHIPGDKSMSHRAIMLASIAEGTTEIHGFLPGDDCLATAQMFVDMGVRINWLNDEKTSLKVYGVGLHGLKKPSRMLDAGNSGTCVRLMMGILAAQFFDSIISGDASLQKRPMKRVADPLRMMGAKIIGEHDLLPLTIHGSKLHGIHHTSQVASAQVKSCVLFAGLYAEGETTVTEPRPSRDHTERMLPLFGQSVDVDEQGVIHLQGTGKLTAPQAPIHIPSDPSSACFFAVAASLVADSNIILKSIGMNPLRNGWKRILLDMGADLDLQQSTTVGDEEVADIHVSYQRLHGVHVNPADVPDAIDEFPAIFAAASLAKGTFKLTNAEELRVKESDRIAVMAKALRLAGATIEEFTDGANIQGGDLKGDVTIDAHGDHRIAMAMAVGAQCAASDIRIENAAAIATSFPDFVPLAQILGMNVHWDEDET